MSMIFNTLQMFPFVMVTILLEWLILWLQRKPLPQLGESAASISLIVNMEIFRYEVRCFFLILSQHRIGQIRHKNSNSAQTGPCILAQNGHSNPNLSG